MGLPKKCPICAESLPWDAQYCPYDGCELERVSSSPSAKDSGFRGFVRPANTLVGAVIDERYEVLQLLGEGGMGCVYRVRHRVLGRLFALKALRPEFACDDELAERFVQEARAAAAINHPHVVGITDFGVWDDGQPYFVMELLEGRTLGSHLRERSRIAPEEVVLMARAIASALSAAHSVGVIHRDLKPDNVMLLGDGSVPTDLKVLDFGLAKLHGAGRLSSDDVAYGTPQYMSPEQARGDAIDTRVDVYGLGILMYEMLTGRVPFESDSQSGVLVKHLHEEVVPPSLVCGEVLRCDGLEEVVLGCLCKVREERYSSMQVVADALHQIALLSPTIQSMESVRRRSHASMRVVTDVHARRPKPARRYRWWGHSVLGLVALGVALGVLFGRLYGDSRLDDAQVVRNTTPVIVGRRAATIHVHEPESFIARDRSTQVPTSISRAQSDAPKGTKASITTENQLPRTSTGQLGSSPARAGSGRGESSAGGVAVGIVDRSETESSGIANPWAK